MSKLTINNEIKGLNAVLWVDGKELGGRREGRTGHVPSAVRLVFKLRAILGLKLVSPFGSWLRLYNDTVNIYDHALDAINKSLEVADVLA